MNSVTIKQKTKKRNKKQDTKIDYWEFRLNWKDPKRNEVINDVNLGKSGHLCSKFSSL